MASPLVRPPEQPPKHLPRDTSVESPERDWGMKGAHKYKGEFEEEGAHVYFGGLGNPDGEGHGHGFIDGNGNFTVFRDPYDPAKGAAAREAATEEYVPPIARGK